MDIAEDLKDLGDEEFLRAIHEIDELERLYRRNPIFEQVVSLVETGQMTPMGALLLGFFQLAEENERLKQQFSEWPTE